jgi:hypothetical protein
VENVVASVDNCELGGCGLQAEGTNCQVLFDQSSADRGVDGSTGNSDMK